MSSHIAYKFGAIVLILTLVFSFAGCQQEKYPGEPTVGLVVKTLNNTFFNDMEDGAREIADSLKLNLIVQAAERETDVEKQMQIIENLIQRKVDAILLTPSGSSQVIPVILKANEAGIPILNLDTRVDMGLLGNDGGEIATYIGSDNFEGGKIAGKFIAEQLNGKGRVVILEGIPGHETADSRQSGFLESLSDYPDIEIVASQPADWERNKGYTVFQNILQSHPDIDALFAANDLMALGAVEAIATSSMGYDDILVVGFDAHVEALQAIRDGEMDATVAQNPTKMGRMGVKYAKMLLNNETIPNEVTIEIELITQENVDKKN